MEEILNNLHGVTSVHGRFYDLSSKYYRIIGNHASYYKDALRYLGCVDVKDLPGERWRAGRGLSAAQGRLNDRLIPQKRRSRSEPSLWGWPASWERESTTLESW